jgi:diacylglycerol kinase (ATP)
MADRPASGNLLHSFRNAFRGIYFFFREQRNARIHAVAAIAVVALGAWLGLPAGDWCLLVLCMVAVIGMEMINTAVEYLADVVSPGHDPRIGKLKDIAAGAVLVVSFGALICGVLIVLVPLLKKLL